MHSDTPQSRGFSLIEMIIVITIMGIMSAVLAPLAVTSLAAYDDVLGDIMTIDKLRYATERLAREIRETQYASTGTGSTPTTYCPGGSSPAYTDRFCFSTMTANSLAFTRVFNEFSSTQFATVTVGTTTSAPCNPACVTLGYSSSNPTAVSLNGGSQILTDELKAVDKLEFTYLDKNNAAQGTPSAVTVHSVRIKLTLNHNGQDYSQETQVQLKNACTTGDTATACN